VTIVEAAGLGRLLLLNTLMDNNAVYDKVIPLDIDGHPFGIVVRDFILPLDLPTVFGNEVRLKESVTPDKFLFLSTGQRR